MNVFHKITRKSLAKNRTRTIVTVIGIILSMALFTAVIEGAYSGVQFLMRSEIEQSGAYHGYYYDATPEQAEQLVQRDDIKDYATWQLVGWTNIQTDLDFNSYATVVSISDNFPELVNTKILEGRMPENENEIIIPADLRSLTNKTYSIGDQITLSVGKRMAAGGIEMGMHDAISSEIPEEITDTEEHTYTIVGAYRKLDYTVTADAGFLLLTKGQANGEVSVFFTLKNISKFYTEFVKNQPLDIPFEKHGDLLLYSGLSSNDNIMRFLYGLVTILVCLISFGSISLIYNSFAISVSERTKQFGVLNSIGATKKQIRQSVLYEALVLAGIGIPLGLIVGCTGIGITLRCLQDDFAKLVNYGDTNVKIGLVLNPTALIVAAVVCLVTVLISAWIPAKRSAKVNAIEAIRQADDVKIKGKEVKTSKLTEKIFGFEGMMAAKNFKRNKKRYRSTVISLFLSVVLFISATSFCSYLTGAVNGVSASQELTDIQYRTVGEDGQKDNPDEVLALLSSAAGVTDGLYMDYSPTEFYTAYSNLDSTYIHKPYGDISDYSETTEPSVLGYLTFVDDDTFRTLCKENHLNADDYFNAENPSAIIFNDGVEEYQEKDGDPWKWYGHKVLDESKLPVTLSQRTYCEFDGYELYAIVTEPNGTTTYVYYPTDYLHDWLSTEGRSGELDESLAMKLSPDEAGVSTDFVVNAVIKNTLFSLPSDSPAIIFPYSMENVVLDEDYLSRFAFETYFAFRCENHQQTYAAMEQLLSDNGMDIYRLENAASAKEAQRTIVTVVKVFAYGFIVLISLIAIANVFNTISTNIALRRREFAMLKSVGLGQRGFKKMMNYECIIYGLKGIIYGLPVAVLVTYAIYKVTGAAFETAFYIPWSSVVIAVGSVFIVVFATMLYATGKIRKDNPMDALKNENI